MKRDIAALDRAGSALDRLQARGMAGHSYAAERHTCSCGRKEAHVVSERTTSDGKRVKFWSDGDITTSLGWAIRGVGVARSAHARERDRMAALDIVDDVPLYTFAELPALVRAARQVHAGGAENVGTGDRRRHIRAVANR